MADKLQGKRVAFLATDMVEQVELTEPWTAVQEAGGTPELVSLRDGEIQAFNHYEKADTFRVDKTVEEARVDDYDALVIPGGVGNPDELRTDENAGAKWVDKEVVVDKGLTTSRKPDDLPALCEKIVEEFCEGRHAEQAASIHADATPS